MTKMLRLKYYFIVKAYRNACVLPELLYKFFVFLFEGHNSNLAYCSLKYRSDNILPEDFLNDSVILNTFLNFYWFFFKS